MQQDIADWLTQWTATNLDFNSRPEQKSDMTDQARRCVADGEAAGFTVAQLKDGEFWARRRVGERPGRSVAPPRPRHVSARSGR